MLQQERYGVLVQTQGEGLASQLAKLNKYNNVSAHDCLPNDITLNLPKTAKVRNLLSWLRA